MTDRSLTVIPEAPPPSFVHTRNQVLFWIAVMAAFLLFTWLFKDILLPFILGTIIAYLLDPAVKAMRRRNIPRWAATVLILGSFGLFLGILLLMLVPLAYKEAVQLIGVLPDYAERIMEIAQRYSRSLQQHFRQGGLSNLQDALQENISTAIQAGGGLIMGLATGSWALVNMIYVAVLTPIIAFLMMNDWPRMKRWLDDMVPRGSHDIVGELWHEIDAKLSGFIRGQLTISFLLGMAYAIGLSVAGLNFGFLIGLMVGVLSLIPLVGTTTGLLVSLVVAWFQSGEWEYVAIIAAIFFTGQFIEGNFLTPRLLGKSVGLHSLWVLFALTAGGALLGIVGMLLAVPVAAVVGVLAGFVIRQYKRSPVYNNVPPPEPLPAESPAA